MRIRLEKSKGGHSPFVLVNDETGDVIEDCCYLTIVMSPGDRPLIRAEFFVKNSEQISAALDRAVFDGEMVKPIKKNDDSNERE